MNAILPNGTGQVNGQAPALPFTRRDATLLLLLALLVALYFWRILTPNPADRAQFPVGDFTDQFYAFRVYEARAFAEDRIPLWSENYNSGHPFLADIQSAVFYPIALANTLLNVWAFHSFSLFALELEALLHFYLAGVFTYLFARRVIQNRAGAFTAALVFTFGGYLTSYPSLQLAILETAIWLPLALFFIHRATFSLLPPGEGPGMRGSGMRGIGDAERSSSSSLLPLGEGSGMRGVGDAGMRGLGMRGIAEAGIRGLGMRGSGMRDFIAAGLVLGVAALAGHPQTFLFVLVVSLIYFLWRSLPTAPTPPGNWRSAFRDWQFALRIVVPIALMLVIAFGIAAIQLVPAMEYQQLSTREALSFADAAKGFPTLDILQFILPGYASAFASPLYVGILPLWLAIFALLKRRNETLFWGVLALGALLLSFGFYVFAYVIFYLFIPGASLFRQQERLAFVVSFALAMLSGYGIADLVRGINRRRATQLYFLLPAGAVLMLVLAVVFFVAGVSSPEGRLAFLGDRAGLMLILLGLTGLLLGLLFRGVVLQRWFVALALVLILFDLWSVSEPANKGQVQERFPDNTLINAVKQQPGSFRVTADKDVLPGHYGIVYGLQDIDGISPLRLANYDALLGLPQELSRRLLNVGYRFTKQTPGVNENLLVEEDDVRVLQLPDALPRAWFVSDTIVQADNAAALETLADPGFDPAQQAVVNAPLPFAAAPNMPSGEINVTAYAPEAMTLQLRAPADGLVVVSENYYPGWRATVDGSPVDIVRTDVALRGIPVRAGAQEIKLWYDPLSYKIGAVLSGLTLVSCFGALLLLRNKSSP